MTGDERDGDRFPFRSVAIAVFAPTVAFAIGQGALIPFIPLLARDMGASLAIAGIVAAMATIGELLGSVPGGALVAKFGERATMIYAGLTVLLFLGLAFFATEWWQLAACILAAGLGTAVFSLARHAFMTTFVPYRYRARSLATLGGTFRLGVAIGPLISSALFALGAETRVSLAVFSVGALIAVVILFFLPDPTTTFSSDPARAGQRNAAAASRGILPTLRANARTLATVGVGAALMAFARNARTLLVPLWAVSIGVDATTTGIVIGLAGIVDFALFFASGWIMDRFGRMWAVVPSILGLGTGFLLLTFTHDVPYAITTWIVAAGMLALANGIGSGILMTLGSDLADPVSPAPFLGAWRLVTNSGSALAPVTISGIVQVASISVAAGGMAAICVLGAVILIRTIPGAQNTSNASSDDDLN